MADEAQGAEDYYEVLQVSPAAEPETIHRVYRLLAQRYHPDNRETGDEARFRQLSEAYAVLSDPEGRARYDVAHERRRRERWRLVSTGAGAENDFEAEEAARLTVLEILYAQRRLEPEGAYVAARELERLTGRPREHLEFTLWFLGQKRYVARDDAGRLAVTAEGAEYLEGHYRAGAQRKRLRAPSEGG